MSSEPIDTATVDADDVGGARRSLGTGAAPGSRAPRWLLAVWTVALGWFLIFGAFFLSVPGASNDEGWIISRGVYLLETGRLGDPVLPESIAPIFSRLFDAGILSPVFGWLYYAAAAAGVGLGLDDMVYGFRVAMFVVAVITALCTWLLARRTGMSRIASFGAVAALAAVPEFLMQSHAERPETMLAACVAIAMTLAIGIFRVEPSRRSPLALTGLALFAWLPAILVHPSGIAIPVMLGAVYLLMSRGAWWTWRTALLVALMIPGALLFLDMIVAPGRAAGSSFGVGAAGPPILGRSLWWFMKTPLHFHQRMHDGGGIIGQLGSTLWFLGSFVSMFLLWRRYRDTYGAILAVASASILATLTIASGSTGSYNVMIAPLAAIAIARLVSHALEDRDQAMSRRLAIGSAALLVLAMAATIPGTVLYTEQYGVYRTLQSRVDAIVPHQSAVLAPAIYYPTLRDREFVSNSWFAAMHGVEQQSFEEGCRAVGSE